MPRAPLFTDTLQIAFVVRDLDASMRRLADDYGIGPWDVYEMGPGAITEPTQRGRPHEILARIGLTKVGAVEWELLQPLDPTSVYAEFLAEHGEGIHHVAVGFEDYDATLEELTALGNSVVSGGVYQGTRFACLSTDRDLGVITEISERALGKSPCPDAVFPAGG